MCLKDPLETTAFSKGHPDALCALRLCDGLSEKGDPGHGLQTCLIRAVPYTGDPVGTVPSS